MYIEDGRVVVLRGELMGKPGQKILSGVAPGNRRNNVERARKRYTFVPQERHGGVAFFFGAKQGKVTKLLPSGEGS